MKKVIYVILAIAALYLASMFVKNTQAPQIAQDTEVAEESIDVIETNPEVTGGELETIVSE